MKRMKVRFTDQQLVLVDKVVTEGPWEVPVRTSSAPCSVNNSPNPRRKAR